MLSTIVARKRTDVAARMERRPLRELEGAARPTSRRLSAVIAQPGLRFIMECKRSSPSAGVLRASFDPAGLARAYAGVADAISVLTDAPYFGGSHEHLAAVRAAAAVPLLCKDFVVEPYQVVEARAHGADAVLLMLSVLDDAAYRACAAAAAGLDMDVLTEVHDERELERALRLDATIIGINNRDLGTLAVDLSVTERLAPLIPRDRLIVSESGIRGGADLDRVAPHVHAVLVGSHLMAAARPDLAGRELVYGAVKICGLTSAADARRAYAAGASLGGVVFAARSPRRVDLAAAATIAGGAPLPLVGVFVDAAPETVAEAAHRLGLRAVQLHGRETRRDVDDVRRVIPAGCEIWKAVAAGAAMPSPAETGADRIVVEAPDAAGSTAPSGGSGVAFDWRLLRAVPDRDRLVLAGGLTAANARRARATGCGVLDVCSGVEAAPGIKSEERLERFFAALRGAA